MPLPGWAVLERLPESPDHEEALTYLVVDVWVRFAAASLSRLNAEATTSAMRADQLTAEFVKRFIKGG